MRRHTTLKGFTMNPVTSVVRKTLEAPQMLKKYYERKQVERYIDQTNSERSIPDLKARFSSSPVGMDRIVAVRRANGLFI
jgi:hypothetical protein